MKRACKRYHFENDHRSVHVKVLELLDPNFGLYVWPSSLVLAEYIIHRLDLFQAPLLALPSAGSKSSRLNSRSLPPCSPKIVLELGAGTALPTLLLAKATDPAATFLIATDRPDVPSILDNIREALKENQIPVFDRSSLVPGQQLHQQQKDPLGQKLDADQERQLSGNDAYSERPRVEVRGLGWGDFSCSEDSAEDHHLSKDIASRSGGLLQLLKDVGQSIRSERDGGGFQPRRIDILLGSDTFYNPPDFEPLLSTVAYIIHRHNPDCVFLTSYQNRSTKRNIDHLLRKWDLEGREIDWQEFGFDMSKYVVRGDDDLSAGTGDLDDDEDDDEDFEDSSEQGEEDNKDEESQTDGENMDYWMQLAKQEIQNQTKSNIKVLSPLLPQTSKIATTTKMPPLVDYGSSSSEDEEEMSSTHLPVTSSDDGMASDDDQGDNDNEVKVEEQGQDRPSNSSHQLGDGGALNSVHLLWICKRGRAESLFEVWRSRKAK